MRFSIPRTATALTTALLAVVLAGCATRPTEPVSVKVIAINDFHGNLKTPLGGIRIKDPADPTKTITVTAGGAEHLATAVAELRKKNPNHVFVAAGDLIGATPLLSAVFRDEPAVEAMSLAGLDISAVGNHEFDKGASELLRMQRGGCHPTLGCLGPQPFKGARYQYLAASTIVEKTGEPLLPPYAIKTFQGIPVAFIGLTLEGTPSIVAPAGVEGLRFEDEAKTINAIVPKLRAQGIEAIVVLIHEGGEPVGDYNECPGISGPIVEIVQKLDKAVDLIVSGHTHRAYNCRIDGRLVTSGDKYGTVVTDIDLTLDPKTGDVTKAVANNVIVRPEQFAAMPAMTQLIASYEQLVTPLARRVVGRIGGGFSRESNPAGENPLGQLVADAQLAAAREAGAQIAFMNPGGLRAALPQPADGQVRYENLFAVQPFYNNVTTMTLTGAQILRLLESQFTNVPPRTLFVSRGFTYTWDASKPLGQRIVPGSARLDGVALDAATNYRVTMNSFLATGGDGFVIFKEGTNVSTGMMDIDALERYVAANPGVAPGTLNRIVRLN